MTAAERLAAGLVRMPNGCLEWTGTTTAKGYGQIGVGGKVVYTHRLAWSLAHPGEPLPPVVRHYVCDNPPCCDVTHLRSGTSAQNTADMMTKGRGRGNDWGLKTHCTQGHPFDEANTYVDGVGHRNCRACHTAREQIRRERYTGPPVYVVTHCPRGHAYDEANTYVNSTGGRVCRICDRARKTSVTS